MLMDVLLFKKNFMEQERDPQLEMHTCANCGAELMDAPADGICPECHMSFTEAGKSGAEQTRDSARE